MAAAPLESQRYGPPGWTGGIPVSAAPFVEELFYLPSGEAAQAIEELDEPTRASTLAAMCRAAHGWFDPEDHAGRLVNLLMTRCRAAARISRSGADFVVAEDHNHRLVLSLVLAHRALRDDNHRGVDLERAFLALLDPTVVWLGALSLKQRPSDQRGRGAWSLATMVAEIEQAAELAAGLSDQERQTVAALCSGGANLTVGQVVEAARTLYR